MNLKLSLSRIIRKSQYPSHKAYFEKKIKLKTKTYERKAMPFMKRHSD